MKKCMPTKHAKHAKNVSALLWCLLRNNERFISSFSRISRVSRAISLLVQKPFRSSLSYSNALSDLEKFYQEKNILIGFNLANAFNNESCQDASKVCKAAYDELFACVYPLATDCWDCMTLVYHDEDDACYGPIHDASTNKEVLHCPQSQIAVENCFHSLNPGELATFYGNDACECTMRASMRAECKDALRDECANFCSGK